MLEEICTVLLCIEMKCDLFIPPSYLNYFKKLDESDDSWNKVWNYIQYSLLHLWSDCGNDRHHFLCAGFYVLHL